MNSCTAPYNCEFIDYAGVNVVNTGPNSVIFFTFSGASYGYGSAFTINGLTITFKSSTDFITF